jgi:hypothetical protein
MENQIMAMQQYLLRTQIMIDMKSALILLALISFISCTGQKQADKRILSYTTFYWEKNTEDEFHALRCDTLNCSLISFGPNEANSRRILRLQYERETILLIDSASKQKIGQLIISNDTLVSLQIVRQDKTYKMIPDSRRFAELFSFLKGKYSFECVSSNKISYNGITAMETIVDPYLKDKSYKPVSETLKDEIYGSETSNYLEYHGNRFYYIPKKSGSRFGKMEIVSNDIDGFFLNIRIGDTRAQVLKRLRNTGSMYRSSKNEITVDVCNSHFPGQFGFIKFKFRKIQKAGQEQVLEKIVYQPLVESE